MNTGISMLAPHAPAIPRLTPVQCALLAVAVLAGAFLPVRAEPRLSPRDSSGDPRSPGSALLYAERIDANRASRSDFEALPGIGPAGARRLVVARGAKKGFCSIEEVRRTARVGGRLWVRIAPLLTVTPAERCALPIRPESSSSPG